MTHTLSDRAQGALAAVAEVLNQVLQSHGLHFGYQQGNLAEETNKLDTAVRALNLHLRDEATKEALATGADQVLKLIQLTERLYLIVAIRLAYSRLVPVLVSLADRTDDSQASALLRQIIDAVQEPLQALKLDHDEMIDIRCRVVEALSPFMP